MNLPQLKFDETHGVFKTKTKYVNIIKSVFFFFFQMILSENEHTFRIKSA